MSTLTPAQAGPRNELRFASLFDPGRGFAFPCDATGHVDMDALSGRARQNYFYARTCIGREFCHPVVEIVESRGRDH